MKGLRGWRGWRGWLAVWHYIEYTPNEDKGIPGFLAGPLRTKQGTLLMRFNKHRSSILMLCILSIECSIGCKSYIHTANVMHLCVHVTNHRSLVCPSRGYSDVGITPLSKLLLIIDHQGSHFFRLLTAIPGLRNGIALLRSLFIRYGTYVHVTVLPGYSVRSAWGLSR